MPTQTCPRCGQQIEGEPIPSRTDNVTGVCYPCAVGEGLDELEDELIPQSEWPLAGH